MKAKEKRIKAWLDFIQADLDALRLDKLIPVIYPIYEDFFLTKIQFKKMAMDLLRLSSGNHEEVSLPKELQRVLKIIDDPARDKDSILLQSLSCWDWNALQEEARKFMEKIMAGPESYVMIRVYEFLIAMESGIFRKSTNLPEGEFIKEIVPILIDLFDGVHRSAFKQCPECEKWFFHTSKRKKEFCTNRCASRYLTRKKRTESEEAREEYNKKMRDYMRKRHKKNNKNPGKSVDMKCPGNDELVQITLLKCITRNKKDVRWSYPNCTRCAYLDEEGNAIIPEKNEGEEKDNNK